MYKGSTMGSIGFAGLLLALLLVQARAGYLPAFAARPSVATVAGDMCDNPDVLNFAANDLCEATGLTLPDVSDTTCNTLYGLEFIVMAITSPFNPATCTASLQTPVATTDLNGAAIPRPLADMRSGGLPQALPADQFTAEGANMYWHMKNIHNFALWAPCATVNKIITSATKGAVKMSNKALQWLVPAGWTVQSTLWAPVMTENYLFPVFVNASVPIATILTHSKSKQMTILIRGTQTVADALTDFEYNLNTTGSIRFPGETHQGFTKLANALWRQGVREALYSNVVKGSMTSVSIAGHSMGGGVATLLAYAAQDYLNSQLATKGKARKAVKVDAYLFASPNVADSVFTSQFNNMVNARRIAYEYDLVPQLPCTPAMTACMSFNNPSPPLVSTWAYSSVGGSMPVESSAMPQQAEQWAGFQAIDACQALHFLSATHLCSYNCFLSQFAGDKNNSCLLWEDAQAGSNYGTYCGTGLAQFPVDGTPYPVVV